MNVAAAPFRFIGDLVGISDGEAMKFIQFLPGSRELPPHQQEKLINLDKALKARPGIKLEIHGAYDIVYDKKALQEEKFDMLYISRLAADGNRNLAEQTLSHEVLEQLYREIYSDSALTQLQNTYKISKKDSGAGDHREAHIQPDLRGYYNALHTQLIAAQPVSETELSQLALDRAQTIRKQLIEVYGIEEKRIVIMGSDVLKEQDDEWVNCRLGIDTL